MIYYRNSVTSEIHAYDNLEDAKKIITSDFVKMSKDEIDKHENPESYYTDEQKRLLMPTLKPIDFDVKLSNAGLYDAVQELIKDNFNLRIAYTRATYFSRTDPFIDQARIALGLTNEQVDELWTAP